MVQRDLEMVVGLAIAVAPPTAAAAVEKGY
jgi:hypothetical protein